MPGAMPKASIYAEADTSTDILYYRNSEANGGHQNAANGQESTPKGDLGAPNRPAEACLPPVKISCEAQLLNHWIT
jgi:hypothetical protein